jgi:hypothetical protein
MGRLYPNNADFPTHTLGSFRMPAEDVRALLTGIYASPVGNINSQVGGGGTVRRPSEAQDWLHMYHSGPVVHRISSHTRPRCPSHLFSYETLLSIASPLTRDPVVPLSQVNMVVPGQHVALMATTPRMPTTGYRASYNFFDPGESPFLARRLP